MTLWPNPIMKGVLSMSVDNLVLLQVRSPRYVIIVKSSLLPQWLTSLVSRAYRTVDLLRDTRAKEGATSVTYIWKSVIGQLVDQGTTGLNFLGVDLNQEATHEFVESLSHYLILVGSYNLPVVNIVRKLWPQVCSRRQLVCQVGLFSQGSRGRRRRQSGARSGNRVPGVKGGPQ